MPYRDFQEIKRTVTIRQAASQLGLMLKPEKQQFRGICPSCNTGGDRALVLTPERGLFYCFAGKIGGDCLALVQHITGVTLQEAAEFLLPQDKDDSSPDPAPKQADSSPRGTRPKEPAPFDPSAFAAKLQFTEEVAALGFTEEDAERFEVGTHRGFVYFPIRDPNGSIAGFVGYKDGQLKLPPKWLPQTNVVRLKTA